MTREQAHALCDTAESYVEFYAGEWLVVPYAAVTQPQFFTCVPGKKVTV